MPTDEKTQDRLAASEDREEEARAAQLSRQWNLRTTEARLRSKRERNPNFRRITNQGGMHYSFGQ
jgi:hypothetical protein